MPCYSSSEPGKGAGGAAYIGIGGALAQQLCHGEIDSHFPECKYGASEGGPSPLLGHVGPFCRGLEVDVP